MSPRAPRRALPIVLGLLGALALAAAATAVVSASRSDGLKLWTRAADRTVAPGHAVRYVLHVRRTHRTRGAVRLSASGLPRGARMQWAHGPRRTGSPLRAGRRTTRLRVSTSRRLRPGVYRFRVRARHRGGATRLGLVLRVRSGRRLAVSGGTVAPLRPGARVPLDLRIRNPYGHAVRLVRLGVRVGEETSRPGCSGGRNFGVRAAGGLPVRLPRGTTPLSRLLPSAAWPQLEMRNLPVSQDACQGTRLRLRYAAEGRR